MDQEDTMDFKALRAKFQEEQLLLKGLIPKSKPVLPEKPKVVPPPQSPTHLLPAGARPTLLTTMEGKSALGPRVFFKDDKKESKKPLIPLASKGKEKSDGKSKASKDKSTKGGKDKLDAEAKDLSEQKQKKIPLQVSGGLVPATPPPKPPVFKKKGFLVFKKSIKKEAAEETPADPILDAPSPHISGPAPLIPISPFVSEPTSEPVAETQTPMALAKPLPSLPDYSPLRAMTPPPFIPAPPNGLRVDDIPVLDAISQEIETMSNVETPDLHVSVSPRPATPTSLIPTTPSPVGNDLAAPSSTPPGPSSPDPAPLLGMEPSAGAAVDEVQGGECTPPALDTLSITSTSPKAERPLSALSALERAVEMSPGKRTTPADQRILNALEKARRMTTSPHTTPSTSHPVTPTSEELPPSISPTQLLDLPPIDYDDLTRNLKPAQDNDLEYREPSPMLEGIAEYGSDTLPELLVVPPPPPRKPIPDPQVLGPTPEKPARPPIVDLTPYLPPPLEGKDSNSIAEEIPAPPEFWEAAESSEWNPEFEDAQTPERHSPQSSELVWGNGEYSSPEEANGRTHPDTTHPELYSNGIADPGTEAYGSSEDFSVPELQGVPEAEQTLEVFDNSSPTLQDIQPVAVLQVEDGTYESGGNVYEDVNTSATKKKVKTEAPKKRKGPPKNPYDESSLPTNEEKNKIGWFLKSEKRTTTEGPDEKELKKKEKQRLEKEKKELKEQKEREKKEQKEKEKKENEMKKKFKITGQEEAMYQATVTVTSKGRKNGLPVKSGDIVSIIRTTNCPKGKWLARNGSNDYGYIAVDHVELDIKEMMAMGKRAAITRKNSSQILDVENMSTGSRNSNHYPLSTGSFTDDSEEWTGDDEDPVSSPIETGEPLMPQGHTRTHSLPVIENEALIVTHQHSNSDIVTEGPHMQARHEALQKLATFFHAPKPVVEEPTASDNIPSHHSPQEDASQVLVDEETVSMPPSSPTQEEEGELSDLLILPPPDLYADILTPVSLV